MFQRQLGQLRLARTLVSALLLIFIVFMFEHLVARLTYYPMRYPEGDWQLEASAGAQDAWLTTSDRVRLNAWWFPKPGARLATLFLHGNAGNLTHRIDHAQEINSAGSAVLVIDYRGYGKSEGHPSEHGLKLDAEAGYEELRRLGYSPNAIIIHGESLGTAVAVDLASHHAAAGLILESPFASLGAMAGTMVPIAGPLLVRGFDTESLIKKVHCAVLIMHGDADEVVPFAQGRSVFAAANNPKEFWAIHGGHHNDLLFAAGDAYPRRLHSFYNSLTR